MPAEVAPTRYTMQARDPPMGASGRACITAELLTTLTNRAC